MTSSYGLYTQLFEFTTESKEALNTLKWICEKFVMDIQCTDDQGTIITFKNVDQAKEWVKRMVTTYEDRGTLFDLPKDQRYPLIQTFPLFRMNECLYHIIWYVIEEKLIYDFNANTWNNKIKNEEAKLCANKWLQQYNLCIM